MTGSCSGNIQVGVESARTVCNDLCSGCMCTGSLCHSHYFSGYLKISTKNKPTYNSTTKR